MREPDFVGDQLFTVATETPALSAMIWLNLVAVGPQRILAADNALQNSSDVISSSLLIESSTARNTEET